MKQLADKRKKIGIHLGRMDTAEKDLRQALNAAINKMGEDGSGGEASEVQRLLKKVIDDAEGMILSCNEIEYNGRVLYWDTHKGDKNNSSLSGADTSHGEDSSKGDAMDTSSGLSDLDTSRVGDSLKGDAMDAISSRVDDLKRKRAMGEAAWRGVISKKLGRMDKAEEDLRQALDAVLDKKGSGGGATNEEVQLLDKLFDEMDKMSQSRDELISCKSGLEYAVSSGIN